MSVSGHGERTGVDGLHTVESKMRKLSGLGERRKARSERAGEKETLIGQVGPVAFATKKAVPISKFSLPPPTRFTFLSLFFP